MKNLFILFTALITLAGCSKNVKELPAPNQTGSNTFGASVNGKLWAPKGFGIMPTAPIVEASTAGGNNYMIHARNFASSPTETEFEFYLKDITGPGTYNLNQTTGVYPNQSASYGFYTERRFQPKYEWITSPDYPGTVTITKLDQANRIISGTFQFKAKDIYGDAQPITVTDGRFDVKFE